MKRLTATLLCVLMLPGALRAGPILEDVPIEPCFPFDVLWNQLWQEQHQNLPFPRFAEWFGYEPDEWIDAYTIADRRLRPSCFKWDQCYRYGYQMWPFISPGEGHDVLKAYCDLTFLGNAMLQCSIPKSFTAEEIARGHLQLPPHITEAQYDCAQAAFVLLSVAFDYGGRHFHTAARTSAAGNVVSCSTQSCVYSDETLPAGERYARCWSSDPEPECGTPRPPGWDNSHCLPHYGGCRTTPEQRPLELPGNDVSRDPNLDPSLRNLMFALGVILLDLTIRVGGVLGFNEDSDPGRLIPYEPERAERINRFGTSPASEVIDNDPATAYRSFPNNEISNRWEVGLEIHFDPEQYEYVPLIERLELLPYRKPSGELVGFPAWYLVEALQGDTVASAEWTVVNSFTEQPGPYRDQAVVIDFEEDVAAWGLRIKPIALGEDTVGGGYGFGLAELRAGYVMPALPTAQPNVLP